MPRGWGDLGRQLAIWFGFALIYQLVRGLAGREPVVRAYSNGLWVVHIETQVTHRMFELTFEVLSNTSSYVPGGIVVPGGLDVPMGVPSGSVTLKPPVTRNVT